MKLDLCVHKVPIFSNLELNEMQEITSLLNHKSYKKNEVIYNPGVSNDKLYIVNSGSVKISRISEDGKEQIIRILDSGDFTGDLTIFNEGLTNDYATALEDTNICTIDRKSLFSHMATNHVTSIKIIQALSSRLTNAEKLIEGITIRDAVWRLANLLVEEANIDNVFTFTTTKAILASKLGMTQETFSRKLGELQDLELIQVISNKEIKITNLDKLKQLTR